MSTIFYILYKYKINVFKYPFSDISRLVKTEKQLQKTSTVGIRWVFINLFQTFSVFSQIIFLSYLQKSPLGLSNQVNFFSTSLRLN